MKTASCRLLIVWRSGRQREFWQIILCLLIACLCGCSGSHCGEIKPIAGTELQAWEVSSIGEEPKWQVLATSTEIERFVYSSARSGSTEIWFRFSAEHYKKLLKRLHDDGEPRLFRVVMNKQVVCKFEWDVFASVGHPDLCIRLLDPKDARLVLNSLRANKPLMGSGCTRIGSDRILLLCQ